jgi:hypothetical protein
MQKFLMAILLVFVFSCGRNDSYSDPQPSPQPSPSPNPNPNVDEFQTVIKPILTKACAGGSCHTSGGARDKAIQTQQAFVGGTSGQRIQSGSMPPQGSRILSSSDKSTLLAFIAKNK